MSHFNENKTELEIFSEEKVKSSEELIYNFELEMEEEDFIEIRIEEAKETFDGDNIHTSEQLPPEFRGWISSRPKFLFSLFKQRRFKDIKDELYSIRERLRQEFWSR